MVVVLLGVTGTIYAASKLLFERNTAGAGGGRATTGRSVVTLPVKWAWGCTILFGIITFPGGAAHLGVLLKPVSRTGTLRCCRTG